jgi:hypothetical protein
MFNGNAQHLSHGGDAAGALAAFCRVCTSSSVQESCGRKKGLHHLHAMILILTKTLE